MGPLSTINDIAKCLEASLDYFSSVHVFDMDSYTTNGFYREG